MVRAKWGQNFLSHAPTARRIVEALDAGPSDRVLEIGPGRGALTGPLAVDGVKLTAVELDKELAEALRRRFVQVETVNADFLKWPLPPADGMLVIGNLPYSVAGPILRKVLDWPGWRRAVFMVQKEVGLRMIAQPGGKEYGLLSLAVQSKATAKRLFDVGPANFKPRPLVTSTVIALEPLPSLPLDDEKKFFEVAHAAFGQRRKTLINSLSHGLGLEKEEVGKILEKLKIDPTRRAETVTLQDYVRLARLLPPGDVHAKDVRNIGGVAE